MPHLVDDPSYSILGRSAADVTRAARADHPDKPAERLTLPSRPGRPFPDRRAGIGDDTSDGCDGAPLHRDTHN